jgi:hypothetical protein
MEIKRKSILNTIEKDGSLSEFRILRDMGYGTERKQFVIKLSPHWIPGTVDNKPS